MLFEAVGQVNWLNGVAVQTDVFVGLFLARRARCQGRKSPENQSGYQNSFVSKRLCFKTKVFYHPPHAKEQ
jgi:hypothetical protein